MCRNLFDVENTETLALSDALYGRKRQVRIMLVIDRIELALVDQIDQVWELES